MVLGIYCYIDTKDDSIVYVGKDSYIDEHRRHKEHYQSCHYNYQQINRVLQNNPNRYNYNVLEWNVTSQADLNDLEISYIAKFNPKFNFIKGGDGMVGFTHSEKTKNKMSKIMKGKNNPFYGKWHSDKTKLKIKKSKLLDYPTIIKKGLNKMKKQQYAIVFHGNTIKSSIDKKKLEKYLEEHIEEILIDQINDDLMEGLL